MAIHLFCKFIIIYCFVLYYLICLVLNIACLFHTYVTQPEVKVTCLTSYNG